MTRKKTKKFEQNKLRRNIVEPGKPLFETLKGGGWQEKFFQNENPIVLELACGRGEYTVGLASHFSDRNFIGVDMKGDRLWTGSGIAEAEGLENVAMLRVQIQLIAEYFSEGEISEMWLTFPDPRPKLRDERRRLTNLRFMTIYRSLLQHDGWFKFKTDNTDLFEYTLQLLETNQIPNRDLTFTRDLYQSELLADHYGIQTKYEKIWHAKGSSIKYMKFRFQ